MATRGLPAWPLCGVDADELPDAERLLLDALRRWSAGGAAGPLGEAAILLAAAGLEGAALPLDTALRALPLLTPAATLAPKVMAGEGRFLLGLAELQRGRRHRALALLSGLAPPPLAYRALPALGAVSAALRRGGFLLTERL